MHLTQRRCPPHPIRTPSIMSDRLISCFSTRSSWKRGAGPAPPPPLLDRRRNNSYFPPSCSWNKVGARRKHRLDVAFCAYFHDNGTPDMFSFTRSVLGRTGGSAPLLFNTHLKKTKPVWEPWMRHNGHLISRVFNNAYSSAQPCPSTFFFSFFIMVKKKINVCKTEVLSFRKVN